MHRFYCANVDLTQSYLTITSEEEYHHLTNVLRLQSGDTIEVFNGRGEEATGIIQDIQKNCIELKITAHRQRKNIGPILILACAIPKKSKFEFIIEKCTELGVDEIIPLQTKRTEVLLKGERRDKKRQRYTTIAINAAKQSDRASVPVIHPITPFTDVLKGIQPDDTALIPCLQGKRQGLLDVFPKSMPDRRIIFFIGPEGDFTPGELEQAFKKGCIPVTLGEHVLKVDTAAISVLALARCLLDKK